MSDGQPHIGRNRRSPITIPTTKPPARGGTVTAVKYTPTPIVRPKKGKR